MPVTSFAGSERPPLGTGAKVSAKTESIFWTNRIQPNSDGLQPVFTYLNHCHIMTAQTLNPLSNEVFRAPLDGSHHLSLF